MSLHAQRGMFKSGHGGTKKSAPRFAIMLKEPKGWADYGYGIFMQQLDPLCTHPAPRPWAHHRAMAAAAPSPHPTSRASRRGSVWISYPDILELRGRRQATTPGKLCKFLSLVDRFDR
jgi:hypothetical protein